MTLLEGKVAVVTGAGAGMGRASVEVFAREGACVVASDVSGREQETAASVGSSVVPFHCDVTSEVDIEAMVAAAVKTFGRLDVMLNVAGIVTSQLTEDLTQERYDATMDVNLRGVMFGMKHGIRAMLANDGGVILNWSSTGGLGGTSHAGVYVAAKHAIIGATKTAAIEYGPKGIRVNAICPGAIKTEGVGAHAERLADKAALRRFGQPQEVAEVAAFLASDRASFITGASIVVDGGWSAQLA